MYVPEFSVEKHDKEKSDALRKIKTRRKVRTRARCVQRGMQMCVCVCVCVRVCVCVSVAALIPPPAAHSGSGLQF